MCHIFQRALCQLSPSAPSAGADSAAGSRPGASFPPSAGGQSSARRERRAASSSQHRWGWWIQIIHWQPICRQRRRYRWDHKHKQSVPLQCAGFIEYVWLMLDWIRVFVCFLVEYVCKFCYVEVVLKLQIKKLKKSLKKAAFLWAAIHGTFCWIWTSDLLESVQMKVMRCY